MIEVEIDNRAVIAALRRVQQNCENPAPLLKAIGEKLMLSTKERFVTSTAPDGSPWADNSDVTLLNYLRRYSSTFGKRGGLTKKGITRLANKKPLIGEGRRLSADINYRVEGDNLFVGTPKEYGAVQQFGAKQGEFGRDRRNHPLPWGNIPARPFLGISDYDRESILREVSEFLSLK